MTAELPDHVVAALLRAQVLTVRYCKSCFTEYGVLGECLHSDDPTWSEMAVVPLAALTPPEDDRG